MAQWPELDELKLVVDITSTNWDGDDDNTRLTRLLAAAINRVKLDVGNWDEYDDEPDDALAQAALRMAELMCLRPEASAIVGNDDPTYQRLLVGHRRVFGIA